MFKIFLILFISTILSLKVHANNRCSDLFQNEISYLNPANKDFDLKASLKNILLDESVVSKIDTVRRKYDDVGLQKMSATVQFLGILAPYTDLIYSDKRTETEIKVLEIGMDNILDDFMLISPRYVSTDNLMAENIALISAILSSQNSLEMPPTKEGNVISISNDRFRGNSEYMQARKSVFDMISEYRNKDYIPRDIVGERVESLLMADTRYQILAAEDKYVLADRIVKSLENATSEDIEVILERFFSSRENIDPRGRIP